MECKTSRAIPEVDGRNPDVCAEAKGEALAILNRRVGELEREVGIYRNAARLYGVDAYTMLMLAKSKIATCADNIRIVDRMEHLLQLFDRIPDELSSKDVEEAMVCYDGDESKPFCDTVYCGLSVIRDYLNVREEYAEWRKDYVF